MTAPWKGIVLARTQFREAQTSEVGTALELNVDRLGMQLDSSPTALELNPTAVPTG